jgi:hypothetical protein
VKPSKEQQTLAKFAYKLCDRENTLAHEESIDIDILTTLLLVGIGKKTACISWKATLIDLFDLSSTELCLSTEFLKHLLVVDSALCERIT